MASQDSKTEELIERAAGEDALARQELLVRHQARLRQMIAVRMDRRLSARLDPSDGVQEVFADACQRLSANCRSVPCRFIPGCGSSPGSGWSSCINGTFEPNDAARPASNTISWRCPTNRRWPWRTSFWLRKAAPAGKRCARNYAAGNRGTGTEAASPAAEDCRRSARGGPRAARAGGEWRTLSEKSSPRGTR